MYNQSQPLSSLPLPPSTLSTLTQAGYETLEDLPHNDPANQLTNALKTSLEASQALYPSQRHGTFGGSALPSTQSAAALIESRKLRSIPFTTRCPPVNGLLNGGLPEGHILELSGPPGSPKELVLLNILRSFVEAGRTVLFVDCQGMCDPRLIDGYVKGIPAAAQLVSYVKINNLTDFIMLMHNLPLYSSISLLAISCISFPFQNSVHSAKSSLLEKIKQTLTKLSSQNVTVVVTSQLSTKMLKPDGTAGSFDSAGARGVMTPQLDSTYLPSGKTSRVLLSLSGTTSGIVRLLAPVKPGKHSLVKPFEIRGHVLEETEGEM
ncbi:hypothetical protein BT96DRAFT_914266 [Gymnopus androsaceus JB14]|uniref:P-loop containing nucleoside triphosphate hydrolase protein n=1 Tax=Gymnopus androsaceus JB14 TaxID=1447944 RepID=A0A6A4ID22_9AGAR|nr:hypothetical protein BT96DRAFT_914266 [Gymnopus androsaceus JB14]